MRWTVTFFNRGLEDDILVLPAGFVARLVRHAERMELFGPDLGMPHMRAMGGGLFEFRLKAAEGIARICYCTVIGQRIVFLHQFIKRTDKAPRSGTGHRPPTDEGVET